MKPYIVQIGVDDSDSGVCASQDWAFITSCTNEEPALFTEGGDKEAYLEECARCGRVVRIFDDSGVVELYRSYTKEGVAKNCKLTADFIQKAHFYLKLAYETNKLAQELDPSELKRAAEQMDNLLETSLAKGEPED